jgi:hypothetical protein
MANNWKEICARCKDGDIEPLHCEYYGEPNGCNSPIYGEHPSTPNAAAMHSCLIKILAEMIDLGGMERGRKARFSPDAIAEEIRQALAVPPRNCDMYANHNDAMNAFDAFVRKQGKLGFINLYTESFRWLFAHVTEQKGESDGSK